LPIGLADLVDHADIGVIEGSCRFPFTQKALLVLLALEKVRGKKLQSDGAVEIGVLGPVNHTHAARAEFLEDAVVRDGLADHGSPLL
jgi:hypothetical protein